MQLQEIRRSGNGGPKGAGVSTFVLDEGGAAPHPQPLGDAAGPLHEVANTSELCPNPEAFLLLCRLLAHDAFRRGGIPTECLVMLVFLRPNEDITSGQLARALNRRLDQVSRSLGQLRDDHDLAFRTSWGWRLKAASLTEVLIQLDAIAARTGTAGRGASQRAWHASERSRNGHVGAKNGGSMIRTKPAAGIT